MEIGLLVLRAVVGVIVAGEGAQKLFGWFGGAGVSGTAVMFASVGLRPARMMAVGAGLAELTGGLLFADGLLTPLAALGVGVLGATAAMGLGRAAARAPAGPRPAGA